MGRVDKGVDVSYTFLWSDIKMNLHNNLLDYLDNTARRIPDKIAFTDEQERVSFADLQTLGQQIGTYIARRASAACRPVAVLTTHTVADLATFIGAMYAGCFYVPIDASAPPDHVKARLDAINPAVIIDAKTLSDLPGSDIDRDLLAQIRKNVVSVDPAYAIFTSGSTGIPKAALVSHGSAVNLIEWLCDTFRFSEQTVFAGQAPFYFDSSVQEIYATIKCGSTTHLVPRKYFISPLKVLRYVEEIGANVMPWAAAAVKLIANSGVFEKYAPSGVTNVIFGGENMPGKILNIWRRAMPHTQFTNVYGPTETTVECSFYTVARDLSDDESVPIGHPVWNTELLLLDEHQKPVPKGGVGELYVRGIQVGLGYYNNPERTAEAFIQNPNTNYRDTIYRTGDIAKWNEHGELVFLNRVDNQVKHMGSRIELGEVEAVTAAMPGVRLVCCGYDKKASKILLFYEGDMTEKELAKTLAAKLPRYMCPNVTMKIDQMPVTPNGKIDRLRVRKQYYDESESL